jgi:glycosyltransferase involved in cell wall biosynthesis
MTGLPQPNDVTIVLVSLRRPNELDRTLTALDGLPKVRVILNGARLSDYEPVIRDHPSVEFVHNHANLGLSAAWNQGIVTSDTRYVVLSSDDLEYPPGWIYMLLEALNVEDPPLMVGLTDFPPLTAFCLDKRLIALQGWFDHNYSRVYYEDEDWFARCQERIGRHGQYTQWLDLMPRLRVVHRVQHRTAPWNSVPNRVWFWRKWQRTQPGPDTMALPNGPEAVKRRLAEPAWPHLDPIKQAYAAGDFQARDFVFDPPTLLIRAITPLTTNPLFLRLRKLRKWR